MEQGIPWYGDSRGDSEIAPDPHFTSYRIHVRSVAHSCTRTRKSLRKQGIHDKFGV